MQNGPSASANDAHAAKASHVSPYAPPIGGSKMEVDNGKAVKMETRHGAVAC